MQGPRRTALLHHASSTSLAARGVARGGVGRRSCSLGREPGCPSLLVTRWSPQRAPEGKARGPAALLTAGRRAAVVAGTLLAPAPMPLPLAAVCPVDAPTVKIYHLAQPVTGLAKVPSPRRAFTFTEIMPVVTHTVFLPRTQAPRPRGAESAAASCTSRQTRFAAPQIQASPWATSTQLGASAPEGRAESCGGSRIDRQPPPPPRQLLTRSRHVPALPGLPEPPARGMTLVRKCTARGQPEGRADP